MGWWQALESAGNLPGFQEKHPELETIDPWHVWTPSVMQEYNLAKISPPGIYFYGKLYQIIAKNSTLIPAKCFCTNSGVEEARFDYTTFQWIQHTSYVNKTLISKYSVVPVNDSLNVTILYLVIKFGERAADAKYHKL